MSPLVEEALRCIAQLDGLIARGDGDGAEANEIRRNFELIDAKLDDNERSIVELAAQRRMT